MTLKFDLESRSTKNISLNVNPVVLPSYQIWSGLVKWFRNYLELKFSTLKFCPPDAGRQTTFPPGSKTHKKHKISWFLKKKKNFFWEREREMDENKESQNFFVTQKWKWPWQTMKVTRKGHMRRSKITKNELMVISCKLFTLADIIPGTKVQYNKRHPMT